MRYRGGGVGHLATRQCNKTLLADKHTFREEPQDSDEDSDNSAGEGIPGEGEEEGDEDNPGEGEEEGEEGDNSDGDDDGIREENDDDLVVASNDVEVVTAAGFADL
jgi:hypothetical protein